MEAGDINGMTEVFPKLQEQRKSQQEDQKLLATELAIVRRGGMSCSASATEILDQIKAMNGLNSLLKTAMTQLQAKIPKPKTPQEIEKETKDTADYEANLPAVQEAVSAVRAGLDVT